jgi:glutamate-5-semialdehyde dehydrogenase
MNTVLDKAIASLEAKGRAAKAASHRLAYLATEIKNKALLNIASELIARKDEILAANKADYKDGKASGMNAAWLDRLMLNASRIESMAQDVLTVAGLNDPAGEVFDMRTLPNGLQIGKKRVPLGVVGAIYESRPNVTIDISALCLKSGNAVILRGGKEALRSNSVLAKLVQEAATRAGVPEGAVQFIDNPDHALVKHFLQMNQYIDLMIPRGNVELIKFVAENARMSVVTGGIGVCHTFVDKTADLRKAVAIAFNAKVSRPTVCNALDALLVHKDIAREFLPAVAAEWSKASVEMHCDEQAMSILKPVRQAQGKPISGLKLKPATASDYGKQFLALVALVRVVDSLDEALEHIEKHGVGHSEAIITEDYTNAMRFLNEVDAACVYVNASTRFSDGGQFGLGAEVAISTQKMHARGPMGLKELTTYKWIAFGNGQVRP